MIPLDFSDFVGRTETTRMRVDPHPVAALAATLDMQVTPREGEALPPGWHWLFFNPMAPSGALGIDGHPRRDLPGSFLPPIPLPRRMWAASRIRYLAPVPIGTAATRTSRILKVTPKEGRSGTMCFVTVLHTTHVGEVECIAEEQDIVYREAATSVAPMAAAPAVAVPVQREKRLVASPILLFRYSALTFNGHRIHYDLPYARDVEHYRGLVVHGPLLATLLQQFALSGRPHARLSAFEFKGVSPLHGDEELTLQAWHDAAADVLHLRALNAAGALGMQAMATWV